MKYILIRFKVIKNQPNRSSTNLNVCVFFYVTVIYRCNVDQRLKIRFILEKIYWKNKLWNYAITFIKLFYLFYILLGLLILNTNSFYVTFPRFNPALKSRLKICLYLWDLSPSAKPHAQSHIFVQNNKETMNSKVLILLCSTSVLTTALVSFLKKKYVTHNAHSLNKD